MDPFVAEIRVFGFNFAPRGWADCDGQILPISQNTALFSLVGTQYGGNGMSNFALPNLQDSFALGAGNGAGLTPRVQGETGGSATQSLLVSQMPAHTHTLNATLSATAASPAGMGIAPPAGGALAYKIPQATAPMAGLGAAGGGNPHENRHPYLGMRFCIALQGIFPPRS